jgi:hypothetical protein
LQTIGTTLMKNWKRIDVNYHPTCKKIVSFAFSQECFKESDLAKQLLTGWWGQKDDISESVQSLVNANILSDIGNNTYTLHSKVEKEYLVASINDLR